MTIKQHGGVFGRNPTFNNVTVENELTATSVSTDSLSVGGSVITGLNFQGAWDADTNNPNLVTATPNQGDFWIVSVDGSTDLDGITNWTDGDWALYDGANWQRVEGGNTDLDSGVTGTLKVLNGGTGASDAATARTNLGLGTAATTASTDYATAAQGGLADSALQPGDIGSTVQGYDADTAKYDDATANFTGTLQNGGSNVVVDTDIGSTVQGYDADTAKYDDATANFTGTLQNGGSNVVVDTDIGSTVQAYDADTAKLDVAQTFTAAQTFNENIVMANTKGIDFSATAGTGTSELFDDYEEGVVTVTATPNTSGTITLGPTTNTLFYTKIGRMVYLTGLLQPSAVSSPVGTRVEISPLPFTVASSSFEARSGNAMAWRPSGSGGYSSSASGTVVENGTVMNVWVDANTWSNSPVSQLYVNFSYVAA